MNISFGKKEQKIEYKNLNSKIYEKMLKFHKEAGTNKNKLNKIRKDHEKYNGKSGTVFYMDYNLDVTASQAELFKDVVHGLIAYANTADKKEIKLILRITSSGGEVSSYGYATSQIKALKEHGIKVVAVIDKVAASGGYMIASCCDEIYASDFAYIGSIGVVSEFPNFNKLLEKWGIDWIEKTAGNSKRSLTPFGTLDDEKSEKFTEQLVKIHNMFKEHVKNNRESVDIDKVGEGDIFFGKEAKELNLIDSFASSDTIIMNHYLQNYNILQVVLPRNEKTKNKFFSIILKTLMKRFG